MSRSDRNLLILGSLALVVLAVGFCFLLLGPLLSRLDEADHQREQREAQLAQLQQEVADLEEVRRNSPEIERQLLELSKRIPTQPEIPTLTVQIEEITRDSGVTQISLIPGTPAPPPGGGDYSVQPITMSFEGTYQELQEFLRLTRNLARLMTVNDITYEVVEEDTTSQPEIDKMLRVKIEAEVYFQPTGVPSGDAPTAPQPPPAPATEERTDAP
ncbi:MAG TPA: type 4a pilus biogenesis protein PilO [Rubrobacteraceae bacterium]